MFEIIKDQVLNFMRSWRIAQENQRANYQIHYFGRAWQILTPFLYMSAHFIVFGLGLYGGHKIDGALYIDWLIVGMAMWYFILRGITGAASSIAHDINSFAKLDISLSSMPMIAILQNVGQLAGLLGVAAGTLILTGIMPSLYWLQLIYYVFAAFIFIYFLGLFNSAVSVIFPDYSLFISSTTQILMYMSGLIWDLDNEHLPRVLVAILKLNPVYYLITGTRGAFLSQSLFWTDKFHLAFFWLIIAILMIMGTTVHLKFKESFIDYL